MAKCIWYNIPKYFTKEGIHMNFFSSAEERRITLRVVQVIAFLTILDKILKYSNENMYMKGLLLMLALILAVSNIIRSKVFENNKAFGYFFSYVISNLIIGYFTYKIQCMGTEVYNVMLLIELIVFCENIPIPFILSNFIIYYIAKGVDIGLTKINTFESIAASYFMPLILVYFFRNIIFEKGKTEKLNKELESANQTLKEYSTKLEELTVAKERTRIAQEIHDSIGHSLTALSMNLEFAENAISINPEKAKEVVRKAYNITKDCMVNLRKAVSMLKETSSLENLRKAINEIFKNFEVTNKIRFILEMEEEVETVKPEIKYCIYKTVREAITNGIKHGHATFFTIEILKNSREVILQVTNNGLECDNITKSNGIIGIENRINALSGTVDFYSEKGSGFTIKANIPLL